MKMADFGDRIQALMDEMYSEWQKEANKGKGKWDVLDDFSDAHKIAVAFGNFNYQVENGGIEQWVYNGYFHDDAEKFTEYLETGAEMDERCRTILDIVYKLDQYAQETDCDRHGNYRDHDDEDGEEGFICEMADCGKFDTWYYEHCGKEDWWETVSGIIDKTEGREFAPAERHEHGEGGIPIKPTIQVFIENAHDDRIGGFTVPLPTTAEKLQPFLEGAEISGWQDMKIASVTPVTSDIKGLDEVLNEAAKQTISPGTLDELNYLAAKIEALNDSEYELFTSVIEAERHCGSIAEVINIIENFRNFELQPAYNEEQYGEFLLERDGEEAFGNLGESVTAPESLEQYIERLEKFVDKKAYGHATVLEENGAFTENGYLTETEGAFTEVYRGSQDIPAEHRLLTQPGEIVKPLMKLENADIAATLTALHAVGEGTMVGSAETLKALREGQNADLLLTVNSKRVFLTPALEAYKHGEIPGKTVEHWSKMPDTRFFAVRVNDHGDDNGRDMRGDLIELNAKALLANIARYAVLPDSIEAVKSDGFSKTYSLSEWEEVPQSVRNEISKAVPHYPDNSLNMAANSFASLAISNETAGEAVSLDALLTEVNAAYMASAENPQPDMIRVNNTAAKEILARGDADVYRLAPEGAVKLSPIDATKALCFAENRELAVKREDIGGLGKWAERAAEKLLKQNERGEQKKTKNKGEEL